MIRIALTALAICAATATPVAAQDATQYRYLGKNDMGAVMVGATVTGPQTDRRVRTVLAATEVRPTGADNYIFQFSANCTDRTYRYLAMEAYLGDRKLGEQESGMGFEKPEPDSLNEGTVNYACSGTITSGDTRLLTGIAAARSYAFGKARAR